MKNRITKKLLLIVVFALLLPILNATEDVKSLFDSDFTFPTIKADDFITRNRKSLFRWLSKTKKVGAHYPGYRNSPALTFFDLKTWEVNVRFKNDTINSIDISIYNRGDAGAISEENFEKLLKKVDNTINNWLGTDPKTLPKQRLPKNKGYIQKKIWVKNELVIIMKWSLSKIKKSRDEKPEFLNINCKKFDPKADPRKNVSKKTATKKDKIKNIKNNIKKGDDGSVYIDNIPMVDQGAKGYCAVAVTERVLRYYGQEIDQHMMAQIADTGKSGGTNTGNMMEMLKKMGVKFRVKVKVHQKAMNSLELMRDMDKYNKVRKKHKLAKITPYNGFLENYQQVKGDMKTYKEYKCKKMKSKYKKFKKAIIKSIQQGIPLIWGVQLGLVQEGNLPQSMGGHLRMIIGYNSKENEIIFSDTWGAGHELKKMDWDDAWCITTSYSNIYPRK